MPTLCLLPLQKKMEADAGRKLLGLIVGAKLPIGRSCEGEGFCGACRVTVYQDGLEPMSSLEADTLKRNNAKPNERLACLARLQQDSTIGCAAWGELP
jgi:ferredoxin